VAAGGVVVEGDGPLAVFIEAGGGRKEAGRASQPRRREVALLCVADMWGLVWLFIYSILTILFLIMEKVSTWILRSVSLSISRTKKRKKDRLPHETPRILVMRIV